MLNLLLLARPTNLLLVTPLFGMALIPALEFFLARAVGVARVAASWLVLASVLLAVAVSLVRHGDVHDIDVFAVVALPMKRAYFLAAIGSLIVARVLALLAVTGRLLLDTFLGRFLQVRLLALTRLRILFCELALLKVLS